MSLRLGGYRLSRSHARHRRDPRWRHDDRGNFGKRSMAAQGQVRALPGPRKEEMLNQIKRDVVYIAQHVDDSSFIFATNGTEKIGDVDAQILDINAQGARMRCTLIPNSGRILREVYPAMGQSGPIVGQTDLSDWKDFDGVMLPAKRANKQDERTPV